MTSLLSLIFLKQYCVCAGQLSQNTPNDQNDQGRQLQGGAVDGHAVECGRVPTGGRILLDGIRRILDDTGEDSPEVGCIYG